ncbi:protoporphyrinogen oxidase [Leucobacter sp. GX24907]
MPADRSRASAPRSGTGRVVVVGGGISGLAAARELVGAGADVVVLEAETELGGRIRGDRVGGLAFDMGAEAFATRGGVVADYAAGLGLTADIVEPRPLGSWVITDGRALPLPKSGTIGIPARPLSRESARMLGVTGALRAAIEPLLPRRVGRDASSIAELVRARLGRRVLDRAVRPVVLGVYSTEPASMPLSAMPQLRDAWARHRSLIAAARTLRRNDASAGSAVAGLRSGMSRLVEALTDELRHSGAEIRAGVRVDGLERVDALSQGDALRGGAGAWRISCASSGQTSEAGAGALFEADAVILAVDETTALRLISRSRGASGETAAATLVDAASQAGAEVEVVALVIDDARLDAAPRATGALVAPPTKHEGRASAPRIAAKALTHVTAKWPERGRQAGPGRHLLRLSYGRAGEAPATTHLDDDAVQALALRDASAILDIELRPEHLVAVRRRRWRMGAPPSAASARPRTESMGDERLVCAGDWISGTGLASVIPGAVAAARQVLSAMDAAAPGTPTIRTDTVST